MTRRIISLLFLLVCMVCVCQARTPMRQWLVAMPDSVLPLLTKTNRLDFIDFFDYHMDAVVTNRMDGKSHLDTLTADYLLINYTRSCDVAMKLLPVNDSTDVLCMVTTVKAAVPDSRVAFFDAAWQPVAVERHFVAPQMGDFRTAERTDSANAAWNKMDVFFKTYHLAIDAPMLTCRLGTPDFLSRDDRSTVASYLVTDSLVYSWTDGCFVRK